MTARDASSAGAFHDPYAQCYMLGNDLLEAVFQPAAGGRVLRLRHVCYGDLLVPLTEAAFEPDHWPKAGAFPLFPFHNRLRNSAFRLATRTIRLKPNAADGKDVMHGPAHRRPWRVSGQGPGHIEMNLDYHADDDWPFDFTATQRFEVDRSSLTVALSLANSGNTPMPGGIGWHPYFMPSTDGHIRIAARRQWHPFGRGALSEPIEHDRRTPDARMTCDVTRHYSGWTQATARIGGGARISLSGNCGLRCLAALRKNNYLCLEPASHVAGALETLPAACPETGMRLLSPGESLTGTARLSIA